MPTAERDETREERIIMEIVVDAYDEEERAMGWFYYLEEKLQFPFKAKCIAERQISPLKASETVEAIELASEDECLHEMFVRINWQERELAIPLSQIEPIDVDEETQEAIEDWHYWVARGYEF